GPDQGPSGRRAAAVRGKQAIRPIEPRPQKAAGANVGGWLPTLIPPFWPGGRCQAESICKTCVNGWPPEWNQIPSAPITMPRAKSAARIRRPPRCQRRSAAPPSTAATTRSLRLRSRHQTTGLVATVSSARDGSRDHDAAGHLFVPAAAEDVAVEVEGAHLLGHDAHARGLAGLHVDADS